MIKKNKVLVARSHVINIGMAEDRPTTFKLPYSRAPLHLQPEFIPKEKKNAELLIGMYYCQIHLLKLNRQIRSLKLNDDDSSGKGDLLIVEHGKEHSVQVTRLTFTDFETRKSIAKGKSIELATVIWNKVKLDFPLVIKIHPKNKHKIPLYGLANRKDLENRLVNSITDSIQRNLQDLSLLNSKVGIKFEDKVLEPHYYFFDLYTVPNGMHANSWGYENIFVDYDFYGSTYSDNDATKAIDDLYLKKNDGDSGILLIWANSFELHNLDFIVDRLQTRFTQSSFRDVHLMTFHDNIEFFHKTLELRGIKGSLQL